MSCLSSLLFLFGFSVWFFCLVGLVFSFWLVGFFCCFGVFWGFFCYMYYKNSEIQTLRAGCCPYALMPLALQTHCGRVASVVTESKHQKCCVFSEQNNDDQFCLIPSMKNHIPSLALNSWKLKTDRWTGRWTQDTTARLLGSQTDKPSQNTACESFRIKQLM